MFLAHDGLCTWEHSILSRVELLSAAEVGDPAPVTSPATAISIWSC